MNTTLWHDYVVAKVDKLVSDILDPEITITIQQICEQLNSYYQPMTLHYDDELVYANSIKWFMGSCYLVCGNHYPNEVIWNKGMTQNFLTALSFYQYEFATAKTDFAFQENRNGQSLFEYLSYFLHEYKRLLIVRVDLKIKVEHAHLVGVETFNGFMNKLMRKIQNDKEKEVKRKDGEITDKDKSCFEDLRGYAWAIEQGVDTGGLHCHLVLLYNGDLRDNDWYLADAVGKRWVKITEGIGWYFNCSDSKQKRDYKRQDKLGTGMIHLHNISEVNNAVNTVLYLTRPDKYEQRLKAWLPNMRSFGRGTIDRT